MFFIMMQLVTFEDLLMFSFCLYLFFMHILALLYLTRQIFKCNCVFLEEYL